MTVAPRDAGPLCPGEVVPLVATATLASGQQVSTQGEGKNAILWSSFVGQAIGAHVNGDGTITVSTDPRDTFGKPVHVFMRVANQAAAAQFDVPVWYHCRHWISFNGADGSDGGDGSNGMSDGTAGGSGGDGSNGRDGQRVMVEASMIAGPNGPLLSVFARGERTQRLYYLDPDAGELLLRADGGDGGNGGSGGLGAPDQGNGGDGNGGNGGNGGVFFIHVTPDARELLLKRVQFENRGGHGGRGSPRGSDGSQGPPPIFLDR